MPICSDPHYSASCPKVKSPQECRSIFLDVLTALKLVISRESAAPPEPVEIVEESITSPYVSVQMNWVIQIDPLVEFFPKLVLGMQIMNKVKKQSQPVLRVLQSCVFTDCYLQVQVMHRCVYVYCLTVHTCDSGSQ